MGVENMEYKELCKNPERTYTVIKYDDNLSYTVYGTQTVSIHQEIYK